MEIEQDRKRTTKVRIPERVLFDWLYDAFGLEAGEDATVMSAHTTMDYKTGERSLMLYIEAPDA